jgi:glycerophosphoryl diester phosphodiesterase
MKCLFLPLFVLTWPALAENPPPIVIAHRGASGYLPEHTLPAKALAVGQGADYVEQDVVLSKDDVPVVLHDIHVDAISDVAERFPGRQREDGRFYALDFTLAELKSLRLTERFDPKTGKQVLPRRFPKGTGDFRIVTLEEELAFIAGLNRSTGRPVGIYPEIKQPAWHRAQGHDLSPRVLAVLGQFGYTDKEDACYLQCFEHDEVVRLRNELGWKGRLIQLMSAGKTGAGGSNFEHLRSPAGLAELARLVDGIGPAIGSVVDAEGRVTRLVKDAHTAGLLVHPYTLRVDELPKFAKTPPDLMQRLFGEAGVDGLFTDFPDVCVQWLKAARKP